jgi:methionine-rich copper-binding protein CopC
MGRAIAFGLAVGLLLGLPPVAPVRAEAQLETASPGPGAVLAVLPPRLQLVFDSELATAGSQLTVLGPAGERADRRDLQVTGARLVVSLIDQGPGVYRVRWRAVDAEERRRSSGEYTFSIQPWGAAGLPCLAVVPATARHGEAVVVSGSGFTPDSTVALTIGDDETLLTVVRADAQGHFAVQQALPADLPYGRQVVQAADAQERVATAALWVPPPGGLGVVSVRLSGEAQLGAVTYTLRIDNRSDFRLRDVVVRAQVPAGTSVLAEGLENPPGAAPAEVVDSAVVWRLRRLPPHTMRGPFTFTVSTADLSGRPTLTSRASVEYVFADAAQPVRGRTDSEAVDVVAAVR